MIHPTAEVSPRATLGANVRVWHQAQIREGVVLGDNCIIGKGVYIDFDVKIGANVKVQNYALLYHGLTLDAGVFVGPRACFTNDRLPRAINPDGSLKTDSDWDVGRIHVGYGASIGAGAVVLPGVTIGPFALIGAGAVVTRDVPAHALAFGTPARVVGYVCKCGRKLEQRENGYFCGFCEWRLKPE
jgi:acetyltransferase-like isoleucine patch superfamily enzyme